MSSRHRSIAGAPAAAPYQYASSPLAEDAARLVAACLQSRRETAEAATAEALLAEEKAAQAAAIQKLVASAHPTDTDDDPTLEAKLAELEKRLGHRAELFAMRASGGPEGEAIYTAWRSQELYRLECARVEQETKERHAAQALARAEETELMVLSCRQWLGECVGQIDWVLHQREAEAQRARDAAIEALLATEAEKRIAAREAAEKDAAQRYKEREAWYFEVAGDELMRRVRQAARQRAEDEINADAAREEAELQALEAKCQNLLQPKIGLSGAA